MQSIRCSRWSPYSLLFFLMTIPCFGTEPGQNREIFAYKSDDRDGAMIRIGGVEWVENISGRESYLFKEVNRTAELIDLRDVSRDVGLRIYAEHGLIRLPGSTDWQPWQRGKWIAPTEFPPEMKSVPTDQRIRLVYFVAKDRQPIEHYEQKIRVVMQFVGDVYRKALLENNVESNGFQLETGDDGLPRVHVVNGAHSAEYYNGAPSFDESVHFQKIAAEIPCSVGSPLRHMLVVFAETYEPGPAPIEWNGSVGRGLHTTADGGIGIMSAWILRDEFCALSMDDQIRLLNDSTPIEGRTALGPRKLNSARFEFIEDGFGAVAHELGHALGLPHDYRSGNYIMGHGFRSLQVNYRNRGFLERRITFSADNARILSASRYLTPQIDLTDTESPRVTATIKRDPNRPALLWVTGAAEDNVALHAVIVRDHTRDTIIGGTALEGKQQKIDLKVPAVTTSKQELQIEIRAFDASGHQTSVFLGIP